MDIDLTAHAPSERYHLLTQAVIPRPVAWILTADEKGLTNLAPFSFFAPVCSDPATFVVSVGHKPDGNEKDTYNNLRTTGVCVVHIAAADQVEVLNQSSATEHALCFQKQNVLRSITKIHLLLVAAQKSHRSALNHRQ